MGVLREYRILNGSYNEMGIEEYDDEEGITEEYYG